MWALLPISSGYSLWEYNGWLFNATSKQFPDATVTRNVGGNVDLIPDSGITESSSLFLRMLINISAEMVVGRFLFD